MDLIKYMYVYWDILISGKRADSEKLYGFGSDVKGMVQSFSFPNPVTSKDSNANPLYAVKPLIYTKFSKPVSIQYV
jgi:hypothetical protein